MSGHSKWSTIKRQKGVADIKRGQTFTKIANLIALAARSGGSGDLSSNPHLRDTLEMAKKVNMPKDNIQRAIDRGLGKLPGQTLEEVVYEGFGPGRAAFYAEGVTDNKLRTNAEVKNMFERSGGNLGGSGSVAYMFDKKGQIIVRGKGGNSEDELLELIDLGAEDVENFLDEGVNKYIIYVSVTELATMSNKITQSEFVVEESEIIMKPNLSTVIDNQETAQKVMDFIEKLEENDDIQKVYTNAEIPDNLI